MAARRSKTTEVIETVTRPRGLEAVYERDTETGVVTRTVRRRPDEPAAEEPDQTPKD